MEKMTMDDYVSAREQVRMTYGDAARAPAAKRDQELARLYVRSGWTQRELAEVEKLSLARIGQRVCFGKFLLWAQQQDLSSTARQEIEQLTGSKYDKVYWQRTDTEDDVTIRYEAIVEMLEHNTALPKSPRVNNALLKALKETYGDGGWHGLRPMADKLEVSQERLQQVLDGMRRQGTHQTYCERRKGRPSDGGWQYRLLLHQGQSIPYDVLKHETAPLIAELKAQGQKNMATISPGTVTEIAYQLEKLIDKLAR